MPISTEEFCNIANQLNISINNVFEIGSLHGHDAYIMAQYMNTNNVYIFEAHPIFSSDIKMTYPLYNVINMAVTNENKYIEFNMVMKDINNKNLNLGMSSMREPSNYMTTLNEKHNHFSKEQYTKIRVKGTRMDDWLVGNNIDTIDICKIDVEGCSYECLEGFGDKIKIIKILHIENEHVPCWENQKLYEDVKQYLETNDFILVKITIDGPKWAPQQQSDSVWVNKKYLNEIPEKLSNNIY
jgi:FkbM family methyltransferase